MMTATAYLQYRYGRLAFTLLGINMIQPCNLESYAAAAATVIFTLDQIKKRPAHACIMVSLSGGILSTSQVRTIYTLPIESRRFSPFVLSYMGRDPIILPSTFLALVVDGWPFSFTSLSP